MIQSLARRFAAALDHRSGILGIVRSALYEHIPGGARWRYVWGSTLLFTFVVQMLTGFCLWMAYSPGSRSAWESVYYIQHEMAGGWLLRGVHHYTAQAMVVLMVIHVLQVVIDGAYRAPRELNFWIGLILLQIVLGLGLTGYLLPWDQKGYWATKVATNIAALVPGVGEELRQVVVGGPEYGHHTLTRFFALHAGLLPFLFLVFVGIHVALFRRHGIRFKEPLRKPDAYFWPDQVLRDAVACLGVFLVVLFLAARHQIFGEPDAPRGAELLAPADPSDRFSAARPEWYFLFLFQFLKLFEKEEVWGAIYVPGIVFTAVALMPFIGRWKLGHRFNVVFIFGLLLGAGALTVQAFVEDAGKEDFRQALADARQSAERVVELAKGPAGIPVEGAVTLLRNDPKTQGPKLFARHCAICHRFDGHDGAGRKPKDPPSASDLEGFGGRAWLAGFLDPAQIDQAHYFGGTALKDGKMVDQVKDVIAKYDDAKKAMLQSAIKALSAEAALKSQRAADLADAEEIARGRIFLGREFTPPGGGEAQRGLNCVRCHRFHGEGEPGKAPDLSGWGSREWLLGILDDPAHERFYSDRNDHMPAFGAKGILDAQAIGLIADWLRGDWYEPGDAPPEPPRAAARAPLERPAAPDGKSAPKAESAAAESSPIAADPARTEAAEKSAGTPEAPTPSAGAAAGGDAPDFARDLQPIFESRCVKCHHSSLRRPKGDYRLDTRELAFTPGDFGAAPIVPGKSAESALFKLISSSDEDERMPPASEGAGLGAAEIDAIRRWIDAGALWPEGLKLAAPPAKDP
jgi:ubiquinol-cytochrome c reductase cytochrome b subunit